MNTQLIINGTDLTTKIISYTYSGDICSGKATLEVVLTGDTTPPELDTSVVLYINGIKKLTHTVDTNNIKLPDGSIIIGSSNGQKKLENTLIETKYLLSDNPELKTRYWIEKFLTESNINYSFSTDSDGEYLNLDEVLGGEMSISIIGKLLSYSGWYIYFDSNDTAIIGKLNYDTETYKTKVDDTTITSINTVLDDVTLRNRMVVWGRKNPNTAKWVFADMSVVTPWNYDNKDKRATVIANSYISSQSVAVGLCSKALKLFSKPRYVKQIELAGFTGLNLLNLTDRLLVDSKYFKGTGLITTLSYSLSKSGFITSITLDQFCPRLVGVFTPEPDKNFVYVGTDGYGIYRKHLRDTTSGWTDYSTGITDSYIRDLEINNGVMATVTANGSLYTRYLGDDSWVKFNSSLGDNCIAVTLDKTQGNVLAAYTKENEIGVQENYVVDYFNGTEKVTPVTLSGAEYFEVTDIDNNGFDTFVTGTVLQTFSGWNKTGLIASGDSLPYVNIGALGTAFGSADALNLSNYGLTDGVQYYFETSGGPFSGRDMNNDFREDTWVVFGWFSPASAPENFQYGHWGFAGRRILDFTPRYPLYQDEYFDQSNQVVRHYADSPLYDPGTQKQLFDTWVHKDDGNSFVLFTYHAPGNYINYTTIGDTHLGLFIDWISHDHGTPTGALSWELGTAGFSPGGVVSSVLMQRIGDKFEVVQNLGSNEMKIDCSQSYPIVVYGGVEADNSGEMYLFRKGTANDPQGTEITLLYHSQLNDTDRGSNFVTDSRSYSLIINEEYKRLTGFITNTPAISGSSNTFVRTLHYDGINDLTGDYTTVNESIGFPSQVYHLETTNTEDLPYMFVSSREIPSHFYQRNSANVGDTVPNFIEISTGLPWATITVIRVDDSI